MSAENSGNLSGGPRKPHWGAQSAPQIPSLPLSKNPAPALGPKITLDPAHMLWVNPALSTG